MRTHLLRTIVSAEPDVAIDTGRAINDEHYMQSTPAAPRAMESSGSCAPAEPMVDDHYYLDGYAGI